jgi:outer membrane protein TolC
MRTAALLCLLTTTALGPCSSARAHPAAQPLSFAEALRRSSDAPVVREVAAALAVRREADRQLGTLTHNPQISLEAGYRDDTGGRGAVVQAAVQQGLNLAGYAAARRRSAEYEQSALAMERRAVLLRQRLGTVRLWTELWGSEQAERLVAEEVELAKQTLQRTERLFQGGAATQVDVASAQTYLAEVGARRLAIEGEVFEAGLALGRSLGLAEAVSAQGEPDEVRLPHLSDALVADALGRSAQLPDPSLRKVAEQVERARWLWHSDAEPAAVRPRSA